MPVLQPALALARLAEALLAAAGADATLPETKLGRERWELALQTAGSGTRGLCFPRFLNICSKPEADARIVAGLYKSRDAICLMHSGCFGNQVLLSYVLFLI